MGMSKSGTTLAARTLDAAGINFRPEHKRAGYPACPYENLPGCKICMQQIGADRKRSLFMPEKIIDLPEKIKQYIKIRSKQDKEWGFKFPYLTFVYPYWKKYFPEHIAIALKRKPAGLLKHYAKGKHLCIDRQNIILKVQAHYNKLIDSYNIPVIQFEDFIQRGPIVLEKIIGRKLPDVRDGKKH
jgi:hypothetical protein